MTDIVDRLRSPEVFLSNVMMVSPVAQEAAAEITRLRAALAEAQRAAYRVPPGWKLMPVEVDDGMIHQGAVSHDHPNVFMGGPSMAGKRRAKRMWSAMLAAAPQPPATAQDDGWQPIETAPRNHFPVHVWSKKYGQVVAFLDITWTWWPVPAIEPLDDSPTHWRPLPQPPGDE